MSKSSLPPKRLLRRAILYDPAKPATHLLHIIVVDGAITVEIRSITVACLSDGAAVVVVGDDVEISTINTAIMVEIVNANRPSTIGGRIKDKGALRAKAPVRRFNPPDPVAKMLGWDLISPG